MRLVGQITAPDIAAAKMAIREAFGAPAWRLLRRWLLVGLTRAWFVALLLWFDITPARLSHGMSGVWLILRLMVPPSPGAQWLDILHGLGESVAMAFLGTFAAAVLAFPLSRLRQVDQRLGE